MAQQDSSRLLAAWDDLENHKIDLWIRYIISYHCRGIQFQ